MKPIQMTNLTKPKNTLIKNQKNIKLSQLIFKNKGLFTSKNWKIERARDLSIGVSYHDLEANQV